MPLFLKLLIATASIISATFATHASEQNFGQLMISQTKIPATVTSAPVAAGYLSIMNKGSQDDRLIAVETGFSKKSELHTMTLVEGVMRMRPLTDGVLIPAGETVMLKRGADHLMFMKLQEQMEIGQTRKIKLTFEKAGTVEVEMKVVDPAKMKEGHGDHSSHSGHTN